MNFMTIGGYWEFFQFVTLAYGTGQDKVIPVPGSISLVVPLCFIARRMPGPVMITGVGLHMFTVPAFAMKRLTEDIVRLRVPSHPPRVAALPTPARTPAARQQGSRAC